MADLIALERINKTYGKEIPTQELHDVSLSFGEHSFNAIIGASGSGKSTLLNIMGTLDRPTSGAVTIAGLRTERMKPGELARLRSETIGFIFQFHYLLPEFTALENVLMPHRILHGGVSPAVRKRALELMDLMGLSAVRDNLATRMSGGQQQRTAIARALINNPRVVLADEPTGNLDSESTDTVYHLLRDINDQLRTAFVIITHDRRIAQRTDRIVEIADGRILLDVANGANAPEPAATLAFA